MFVKNTQRDMKKLFLLLALVGTIFSACEGGGDVEEENGGGTPFIPEIKISPTTLTYSCNGGEQMVDITANFEYEIAEQSSWITIEQTDKGLVVIVDANKNTTERSAFVSVSNSKYDINKSIEVRQEGFVPKIELAEQSIEVEFEPAEYSVDVTSPYSWEATTKNSWIKIKTATGIAGTKALKFSVTRNEEKEIREGTITLKNTDYNLIAEFYVTQKAFSPEITLDKKELNFAVEGGTQEVVITANFEYEVKYDADWLTIEKNENGISVTVPNYVEVDERTAEITISNEKYGVSKVVKVSQGAFVPELTISPEALNFAVEGGTQEVAITANFGYEVKSDADWLTIEKNENGISVTVPNYVEVDERTAEITISNEKYGVSKDVKVAQCAFEPKLDVTPTDINFTAKGGSQDIYITANFEYEVSTTADWVTYTKTENGITVSAPKYEEVKERTVEITISNEKYGVSKNVTVLQAGLSEEEYEEYAKRVIFYTSSDNKVITPYRTDAFGANIVSNTYENGKGIIKFDIPVTSIGEGAFYDCSSLASVTIPDNVTSIGEDAFLHCSSLTSVTIGNSVTSIGERAFQSCSSLTSVTIPDSVTSIGEYAFYNCSSLTSVVIGNGVTSIGNSAFQACSSLTGITIPDSVTSIGEDAFWHCESLTSVTIGDSVTSIGEYAFCYCSSLASVIIGNSVTSIENSAFYGCTGELIINSKIIETDYTSENYPANISGWLYGSNFTKLTIGNNITKIGGYAFYHCSSLTSITIPDSVTSIGEYAFQGCSSLTTFYGKLASSDNRCLIIDGVLESFAPAGLTSYTIPDSVTSIGEAAFRGCSSLTSITITDSVTSIGNSAFSGCTGELIINSKIIETDYTYNNYPGYGGWLDGSNFTKLTIGNNITKIGEYAFASCSSLTSVTIPDSVTSIGDDVFYGCDSLTSVTIPDSVTSIGSNAFRDCSCLTIVTIGDSVTSIGSYAFYGCSSLAIVAIPDSVTSIGNYAFGYCYRLTSVTIPDSVTSIEKYAFDGCSSLTSVTIGHSVTSIGGSAFSGCSSLTSVTIPDSVTSIGNYAFYGCSSLTAFYGKYASADKRCLIIDGVLNSFAPAGLTSYTIPDSVTSIGSSAFSGCSSLRSVTIPDSVTSIGKSAFYNCSSLTSVTIPESVTSIGEGAFVRCSSLTSITIPDSVTSIGYAAFYDCDSLTSITIPDSVTSIGERAFLYCNSLKNVYCKPTTPPSGNSHMFNDNVSGRKIYVPTASVEAYKSAQYWSDYASDIFGYYF